MVHSDLFHMQIPVIEKVLRTVLVYGGIAVLLRVAGKRELANLNSFDLVVIMLLSNVVQNAIIGSDNSLSGGLLGAAVLVAVNAVVVRLARRYPAIDRAFEGTPTVLVRDGAIQQQGLKQLGLRPADVAGAVRRQGAADVSEIQQAVLAPGGSIVVTLKPEAQDVTNADLRTAHAEIVTDLSARLQTHLARLERQITDGLGEVHRAIAQRP